MLGGPLVALVLLQLNYVLGYPACAGRSNTPLIAAGLVATLALLVLSAAAWSWRRRTTDPPATAFLGALGVAMSVGFLLVVAAMTVPPFVLHPCD